MAVAVAGRTDGSFHATVVNPGVLLHPVTRDRVVGFVSRGSARKLTLLRARPEVSVVFRSGWEWVTVEGAAELIGPLGDGTEAVLRIVREVYAAAVGGDAEDWARLDEEFVAERHTAVLVRPSHVYGAHESP